MRQGNALSRSVSVMLMLILLIVSAVPCLVAAAGSQDSHVLRIKYIDGDTPISGTAFTVYKAADVTEHGTYSLTDPFTGCDVTLVSQMTNEMWVDAGKVLSAWASEKNISPAAQGSTDTDGVLEVSGLATGLYVVVGASRTLDGTIYTAQTACVVITDDSDTDTVEPKFETTKVSTSHSSSSSSSRHYGGLTVSVTVSGNAADKNKDWYFTVELSDRTVTGTYEGMTFKNGVAKFTLKHGESISAYRLPSGITYVVTEVNADEDGYTTRYTGETGVIPQNSRAYAAILNIKNVVDTEATPPPQSQTTPDETGELTVSKTVTGTDGDTNRDWHFRIELSNATVTGEYGGMVFEDGVTELIMQHGQSATATGLPVGIGYTVTELESNMDGYTTDSSGDTGVISSTSPAYAAFVNTKGDSGLTEIVATPVPDEAQYGELVVSKRVEGPGADKDREWHFTVKLDPAINGALGEFTFTDGTCEFVLKDGESAHIPGIPAGTMFTVTEQESNQDGYVTTGDGATGYIEANKASIVKFVNSKPDVDIGEPSKDVPKTGDATHILSWLLMFLGASVSLGAVSGAIYERRRRRR